MEWILNCKQHPDRGMGRGGGGSNRRTSARDVVTDSDNKADWADKEQNGSEMVYHRLSRGGSHYLVIPKVIRSRDGQRNNER